MNFTNDVAQGAGFVHLFALARTDLVAALERIRPMLAADGMITGLVAEESVKVPTDITGDTIRAVARCRWGWLTSNYCAVDATWSDAQIGDPQSPSVVTRRPCWPGINGAILAAS